MLVFANEIVSHITVVDGSAKKERKKRARRDQLKADSDKLELVTRALEMFTLMHLTEPDDKIVTPLRERTSFHPSPGAHLNDFAAGTAKLLINLCDEEKEQTELFINDEQGHVKYHQVTGSLFRVFEVTWPSRGHHIVTALCLEKLELIRPKYNPVPEYADDASDYTAEVEDIDAEPTDEKPEQIEEDVELVSDGFENGIDTETSSPVEINGIEEQNGSDEDGYVSIQHTNLADQPTTTPTATTDQITDDPTDNGKDGELDDDIEFVDEPAVNSDDLVQIPTTMEFVNREVYGEEDKIKEILVEVSSGFNFLAPPDESEPESDQETELKNDLGLSFGTGVEFKGDYVETVTDETGPAGVIPDETVSYENSNYEGTNIDAIKDEPTWQQRQQGPPRQVYRSTGHTNTSYRNSQRYQRNFENRRPTASAGTIESLTLNFCDPQP